MASKVSAQRTYVQITSSNIKSQVCCCTPEIPRYNISYVAKCCLLEQGSANSNQIAEFSLIGQGNPWGSMDSHSSQKSVCSRFNETLPCLKKIRTVIEKTPNISFCLHTYLCIHMNTYIQNLKKKKEERKGRMRGENGEGGGRGGKRAREQRQSGLAALYPSHYHPLFLVLYYVLCIVT